jgi:hypothetical protein
VPGQPPLVDRRVALGGQQRLLGVEAEAEPAQAVGGDHPVAGDDHRDPVSAEGAADGPGRPRLADGLGHLAIGPGVARRDGPDGGEHGPVELGDAPPVDGHRLVGEQRRRRTVGADDRTVEEGREPGLEAGGIGAGLDPAHAVVVPGDEGGAHGRVERAVGVVVGHPSSMPTGYDNLNW